MIDDKLPEVEQEISRVLQKRVGIDSLTRLAVRDALLPVISRMLDTAHADASRHLEHLEQQADRWLEIAELSDEKGDYVLGLKFCAIQLKAAILAPTSERARLERERQELELRLDERKMCAFHEYRENCSCFHCKRIADLEAKLAALDHAET